MDQGNTEFLDPDLLKDAEATAQRPALSASDEPLATAAIPPLAVPFVPPPVPPAVRASAPPRAAADPSLGEPTTRYRSELPPASKRPSWLRTLLTTTFPPPAALPGEQSAAVLRRRVIVACIGFAIVFAAMALVTAFRAPPPEGALSPVVVAAVVLGRALVAIGAGAFSYGLLRMAERLGS